MCSTHPNTFTRRAVVVRLCIGDDVVTLANINWTYFLASNGFLNESGHLNLFRVKYSNYMLKLLMGFMLSRILSSKFIAHYANEHTFYIFSFVSFVLRHLIWNCLLVNSTYMNVTFDVAVVVTAHSNIVPVAAILIKCTFLSESGE